MECIFDEKSASAGFENELQPLFAVLTGCLRVAKESIFTGLNHFKIYSITDVRFDEYFGFTDSEVQRKYSHILDRKRKFRLYSRVV